jgi:hypothetical protein
VHRRTGIYLDDSSIKALKLPAEASGPSVSAKIGEAVDTMLSAQGREVDWSSRIESILERARGCELPELSAHEMIAEVNAVRAIGGNQGDPPRPSGGLC